MNRHWRHFINNQSGSLAVWAALILLVLVGMGALAVDIGRLAVTKSELQKAADSGALAGARGLCIDPPTPIDPNWITAQNLATEAAQKNRAAGNPITSCQVQVGYWDYSWTASTAPANLKSIGIVPTAQDVPAVKVAISKDTGANFGPLVMLFGPVLGVNATVVRAQAVACAVPLPANSVAPGMAFPLATPISFVDQLWGQDPPVSFRIGSAYHDPTGGQWTSFLTDANDVPTIRYLINSGNPGPLSVGDEIYIQPGTKTTIYYEAAGRIGETVVLPIVANDFQTHEHTPVLAFVPFKITDARGGSDKYIEGYFPNSYDKFFGGIGASGTGTPNTYLKAGAPKLIN